MERKARQPFGLMERKPIDLFTEFDAALRELKQTIKLLNQDTDQTINQDLQSKGGPDNDE